MNNFFKFLALFTLVIIVGLYVYLNRYELYSTDESVYKLDRWSQELFHIKGKNEYVLKKYYGVTKGKFFSNEVVGNVIEESNSERKQAVEQAIELVKNMRCSISILPQDIQKKYYYLSTEEEKTALERELNQLTIYDLYLLWLKNEKGELTIHGWQADTIDFDNGKYCVEFSFSRGENNFNFDYYEVHINQGIVRKVNHELRKHYGFIPDPSEEWQERVDEIKKLSNQKDKKEAKILISALSENDFAIQIEAIRMLSKRKEISAVPELVALLKNENTNIVDESSKALSQITDADYGVLSVHWLAWWERNQDRYLEESKKIKGLP